MTKQEQYQELIKKGYSPEIAQEMVNKSTTASDSNTVKATYDDYYNKYTTLANKYGISAMDRATFDSKMDATQEKQGGFIGQILVPLKDQIQTSINEAGKTLSTKAQENGQSIPFNPVSFDIGEWRGRSADAIISDINSKFYDPYTKVQYDITTIKPKTVFTPTELMKNYETTLTADANAPDAVRPEYNYDASNTQKYFDTISKSEQAGTNKAVNAVNETANFVNPYATGSGSQIKAVASMLDNITADQQARAFALGNNEYDRNYTGRYADYEKAQAKKTTAQGGLFNLAKYYEDMTNAKDAVDYGRAWDTYTAGQALATSAANTAAEDRRYNRDTELMAAATELGKPKQQDWWVPFVSAGVGMLTGGVGTAVASGVANTIGGNPWGYNPYTSAINALSGSKAGYKFDPYTGKRIA